MFKNILKLFLNILTAASHLSSTSQFAEFEARYQKT
jgi:hypothetical protein